MKLVPMTIARLMPMTRIIFRDSSIRCGISAMRSPAVTMSAARMAQHGALQRRCVIDTVLHHHDASSLTLLIADDLKLGFWQTSCGDRGDGKRLGETFGRDEALNASPA